MELIVSLSLAVKSVLCSWVWPLCLFVCYVYTLASIRHDFDDLYLIVCLWTPDAQDPRRENRDKAEAERIKTQLLRTEVVEGGT